MASQFSRFLVLGLFALLFVLGFLFGYFVQGSTLFAAEQQIDRVRRDVDSLQLEQLLLLQSPERSCPFISTSSRESSQALYEVVNSLRSTSPQSESFQKLKREADLLSVKSWILSSAVEDKCSDSIATVLFVYSEDCTECAKQDAILQELKRDSNNRVLVYAIDFGTSERIVGTVKSSYGIESTPSIVVKGQVLGFTSRNELDGLVELRRLQALDGTK